VPSKKAKKFIAFLSVFKKQVEIESMRLTKDIAKGIAEEAKDIIENQRYVWIPLKESYAKKKAEEGLDPRILIATGEMYDAIGWGVKAGKVWCGIPSDDIHLGSGLPTHILARIHEFGTDTIPARPLWRPLLSKWIRNKKKFGKKYADAAAKKARKKSGV